MANLDSPRQYSKEFCVLTVTDTRTEEVVAAIAGFASVLRGTTSDSLSTKVGLNGKEYHEGYDRIFGNQN